MTNGAANEKTSFPCAFDGSLGMDVPWIGDRPLETGVWTESKKLAKAHFGTIYSVINPKPSADLPDTFALKKMPKKKVLDPKQFGNIKLESGRNEIFAALHLRGRDLPGVAKIYGVFQDSKYFYVAIELFRKQSEKDIRTGDLFDIVQLNGGIKDEAEQKQLFRAMLQGISTLHDLGIVHLDISLENFLTKDGKICIIDLGQAHRVRPAHSKAVEAMLRIDERGTPGKPDFLAPELERDRRNGCTLMNKQYSGVKQDLYAVGVCMFVMIVGAHPWTTNDRQCWQFLYPASQAEEGRCINLGRMLERWGRRDLIPDEGLNLLERLLCPNPEKRPTAEEALSHIWLQEDAPAAPATETPVIDMVASPDTTEQSAAALPPAIGATSIEQPPGLLGTPAIELAISLKALKPSTAIPSIGTPVIELAASSVLAELSVDCVCVALAAYFCNAAKYLGFF